MTEQLEAETVSKRGPDDAPEDAPETKKQKLDTTNGDGTGDVEVVDAPTSTSEPITIGYKTFEAGAAVYEYYKKLHSKLRKYQNLNEYEFHMVLELIKKGHPEAERKLAGGVKAIQLQDKDHEGRRSSCFHLIRPDGSSEDVSYRKCISRLDKSMADMFAKEDEKQATKDKATKSPRNTRSGGRGRGRGRR